MACGTCGNTCGIGGVGGMDTSLLFFFLILVLLFCNPSIFGCGGDTSCGC